MPGITKTRLDPLSGIVALIIAFHASMGFGKDLVPACLSDKGRPMLLLDDLESAEAQAIRTAREFGYPDGTPRFSTEKIPWHTAEGRTLLVFNRALGTFEVKGINTDISSFIEQLDPVSLSFFKSSEYFNSPSTPPSKLQLRKILTSIPDMAGSAGNTIKQEIDFKFQVWDDPKNLDIGLADCPDGGKAFADLMPLLRMIHEVAIYARPDASGAAVQNLHVFTSLDCAEPDSGTREAPKEPRGTADPTSPAHAAEGKEMKSGPGETSAPSPLPEDPGLFSGAFVPPNEIETFTYADVIKATVPGGALLSVGSFRTLFDASLGQFSRIYMLDYDQAITQFNRDNLALILALRDFSPDPTIQRYQYQALLSRKILSPEVLRSLVAARLSESMEARELHQAIAASPTGNLGALPKSAQNAACGLWRTLIRSNNDRQLLPAFQCFSPQQVAIAYWSRNDFWTKIQAMIEQGRFRVVQGDLCGGQMLEAIAKEAAAAAIPVSMIDLSNVFDFLFLPPGEARTSAIAKVISGLKLLPAASKTPVLLSTLTPILRSTLATWSGSESVQERDLFTYFAFDKAFFEATFMPEAEPKGKPFVWAERLSEFVEQSNWKDSGCKLRLISGSSSNTPW